MRGVWIGGPHHNPFDPGSNDRISARRSSPVSGAWFQGDVKRGAFHPIASSTSVTERFYLGVRFAGLMMPAAPNNLIIIDQEGTNHWIRGGQAKPVTGQL